MTPTTPPRTERSNQNDGATGGQTTEFENHTEIEFEEPTEMGEMIDGARDRSAYRPADIDRSTVGADGQRGGRPAVSAESGDVSWGVRFVGSFREAATVTVDSSER
jgi:hypothetical protein